MSIRPEIASSKPAGAGTIDFNGNTEMVRVKGQLNTIYNLEHLPLTAPKRDTLLLKQIANSLFGKASS